MLLVALCFKRSMRCCFTSTIIVQRSRKSLMCGGLNCRSPWSLYGADGWLSPQMVSRKMLIGCSMYVDILNQGFFQDFPRGRENKIIGGGGAPLFFSIYVRFTQFFVTYLTKQPKEDLASQLHELVSNDILQAMFPNLNTLANICLTIPVATASVERSLPQMKMIKTRLRNRMGEKSLSQS